MTFALSRHVMAAGFAFAGLMMVGVGLTLGAVALLALCLRSSVGRVLVRWSDGIMVITRLTFGLTGAVLLLVAVATLLNWR
jgi:nickel/cobalt transporter (NicO) family protein